MQHSPCKIELDDLLAWRQHAAAVDLSSRRRVLTDLAGTHLSGFRGRGMEFEEHRVYQPGDEVRSMDWRVTARTGEPHIRLYREERERPVILVADLRATMQFGTRGCFKSVLAARALALCAWSAMANGDRVGGLVFDGQREQQLRSAGGRRGVLQLMHALCDVQPRLAPAALSEALKRLLRTVPGGALVALFSDFRGLDQAACDQLRRLARKAELIVGFVHDPLESQLPAAGRYAVQATDADHDETGVLDTAAKASQQRWSDAFEQHQAQLQRAVAAGGGHWLDLPTQRPLLDSMSLAFGRRRLAS